MTALCYADQFSSELVKSIQADFDTLQPSEYKDGSYRLRRYSKLSYNQQTKDICVHNVDGFVQSGKLNKFQGGVVRAYDNLTDELLDAPAFTKILDTFVSVGGLPPTVDIEVHQMRIVAKSATTPTITTPEGIHQDGFDRIGMITIAYHNVAGGELNVYKNNDEKSLLTTVPSCEGSYCVMSDAALWHYANELIATTEADKSYWDLFVLTAHNTPSHPSDNALKKEQQL